MKKLIKIFLSIIISYVVIIELLMHFERQSPDGVIVNYFNALWYTVVTLTTVGYGDMTPVTPEGKVIGYIFLFASFTIFGFLIGRITSFMNELSENKKLGYNGSKFSKHAVIIGWNSSSQAVIGQLIGVGKKVAIITDNRNEIDLIAELYDPNDVYILLADYNNYEFLKKANIEKSSMVFVNLKDDTEKLVHILNLKKHFEGLQYVVSLDNANLKNTFISAGVTHTVSKNEISSKLLASYIFEPDVAKYSEDILSYAEADEDHDIKEYRIIEGNPFIGKMYDEVFFEVKKAYNCILIGISKVIDGERSLLKNPIREVEIGEDDYLLFIASKESSEKLEQDFKIEEGVF